MRFHSSISRRHPALDWARSGAMALSGSADGPPCLAPGAPALAAATVLQAIRQLAPVRLAEDLDPAALLGERAAATGFTRRGAVSAGGSAQLLPAADGWIVVNLPRPEDWASLDAWLGAAGETANWAFVAQRVAAQPVSVVVERARMLGLAVAPIAENPAPRPWFREVARGRPVSTRPFGDWLVVDLSALWAGPLCGNLLALSGARVIKVESVGRPDGARAGSARFFDLLNANKQSVALDFETEPGRLALATLIRRADIVIESARPRALEQLGIEAHAMIEQSPGLTWLSITGYGRRGDPGNWVAFGDDAAAAGGLVIPPEVPGAAPFFCGDAIADPLAGLHATLAALTSYASGGGRLIDVALCDVAAHVRGIEPDEPAAQVVATPAGWEVHAAGERQSVLPPRQRAVGQAAPELGADTQTVLREFGIPC